MLDTQPWTVGVARISHLRWQIARAVEQVESRGQLSGQMRSAVGRHLQLLLALTEQTPDGHLLSDTARNCLENVKRLDQDNHAPVARTLRSLEEILYRVEIELRTAGGQDRETAWSRAKVYWSS